MAAATHTLESIQAAFLSSPTPILNSHTILLGHSLECDLAALKIRHPLCIDTALIFRHPRGPPYKPGLKWLTNKWLGREIQGAASGHDSEEDATACVDLLKLKMANGERLDVGTPSRTTLLILQVPSSETCLTTRNRYSIAWPDSALNRVKSTRPRRTATISICAAGFPRERRRL